MTQPFTDAEIGEFLARSAELSRYDPDPESIECRARLAATLAELSKLRQRVLAVGADEGFWFDSDGGLSLLCNDMFAWGCADAEDVPDDQLALVRDLYRRYGAEGPLAWVSHRRGNAEPQEPVWKHYDRSKFDAARGSLPGAPTETAKGVSSPPVLNDLGPEADAKAG